MACAARTIPLCSACLKTSRSCTAGTARESSTSRSTLPGPTLGSWSASPTKTSCASPRLDGVQQRGAQRQVQHGALVHDDDVRVERARRVARERAFVRQGVFIPQRPVDVVVVAAARRARGPPSRAASPAGGGWSSSARAGSCAGPRWRSPRALCAARPVGAHISTLRPIARHSRTAMCVAKVLPVPGPPVSTQMARAAPGPETPPARATAAASPSFAAAACSHRRTRGTSGTRGGCASRAAMSRATAVSASASAAAATTRDRQNAARSIESSDAVSTTGSGAVSPKCIRPGSSATATSPRRKSTSAAASSAPGLRARNCRGPTSLATPSASFANGA